MCWDEIGERDLNRPEIIQDAAEKVTLIKKILETTTSRQKSYANPKRRDVEFQVGDYVFLKVSPMKGVMRFGKKEKLASRYIRPFEILERIGMVVYRLALPPNMSQVNPLFHVSMLSKYISDSSHMLQPPSVELNEDLTFEEEPVAIVDYQVRQLRSKVIPMVKVLWRSNSVEEHTWETENRDAGDVSLSSSSLNSRPFFL